MTIFYVMSGFLMTLILNTSYQGNVKGFYINRVFRLFIPYWIVLAFILSVFWALGIKHELFYLSDPFLAAFAWFTNLFIVGSDLLWIFGQSPSGEIIYAPYLGTGVGSEGTLSRLSLVGPIFTVAIEIYFYILAPFVVRSIRRSWVFLYLSVFYYVFITATGIYHLGTAYHFFGSAFAYFGFGVIICHLSMLKKNAYSEKEYVAIAVALVAFGFCGKVLDSALLVFSLAAIPSLFDLCKSSHLDRYLGNYSYPVYLVHLPAISIGVFLGVNADHIFWFAIIASLILSAAIHHLVEPKLDSLRDRIRRGESWNQFQNRDRPTK